MISLSGQQQNVLTFLRTFWDQNGYMPTRQEIADHFEWSSSNSAADVLKALYNKGHIDMLPNKARAIRILK